MRDRETNLTQAREMLRQQRIDPIWQSAADGLRDDDEDAETVRRGARVRVYRYLAAEMGLDVEEADPASFDLEQCRQAWNLLTGINYGDVRNWATQYRAPAVQTGAAA